jgi:hypothetical protein
MLKTASQRPHKQPQFDAGQGSEPHGFSPATAGGANWAKAKTMGVVRVVRIAAFVTDELIERIFKSPKRIDVSTGLHWHSVYKCNLSISKPFFKTSGFIFKLSE